MIDSYRRVGNPIWDLIQDFIQTGDVSKNPLLFAYFPNMLYLCIIIKEPPFFLEWL